MKSGDASTKLRRTVETRDWRTETLLYIYRIFRRCFPRWNFLTWGQLAKWIKLYIKVFSRTCFSSFLFYQSPLIYLQVPVFSLSHVFAVWMFWFCVHYLMVSDWSLPFNSSMLLYYFLGDLTSFVVLTCDFIMWAFLYTKIVYMLVPLLNEEPWIPVGFIRICRCFSFHWQVLTWPRYIYIYYSANEFLLKFLRLVYWLVSDVSNAFVLFLA